MIKIICNLYKVFIHVHFSNPKGITKWVNSSVLFIARLLH